MLESKLFVAIMQSMPTKMYSRVKNVIRERGLPLLVRKVWQRIRVTNTDFLAHQMPHGLPSVQMEIKKYKASEEDVLIAKRILTSFHKASEDERKRAVQKSYVDAWDDNKGKNQDDLSKMLYSGDLHHLADYLSNMHMHKATYGVSGNSEDYNLMISSRNLKNRKGTLIKDILVSFAEALGILSYETIVPYVAKKNIYTDPDWLVDEIERKIGIKIAPPQIDGGLFKLALKEGTFDERDLWSLYAAWRINYLAHKNSPIAEIGAGMGKVAMYADRFRFEDYSIFDLPLMNVIQAWYLIKSLPDKKITLYGEAEESQNVIKIMPYWEFEKRDKKYYLILNQDSFPEINRKVVVAYLNKIKKCTKYFLSINQEHQAPLFAGSSNRNLIVPALIEPLGGFERIYRFPFWLRKGYVEEFYKIIASPEES